MNCAMHSQESKFACDYGTYIRHIHGFPIRLIKYVAVPNTS
jgi:hypothetical protein